MTPFAQFNTSPGLIRGLDRNALLREVPDQVRDRAKRRTI